MKRAKAEQFRLHFTVYFINFMAESNSAQNVDENGIKIAQPSDIILDVKSETKTIDEHIINGSVHYTGEDIAPKGEISSSEKTLPQNGNGIEGRKDDQPNGDAKSELGDGEGIVKPAPAESLSTVQANGAVKLLLGSTESTSRTPKTVVQGLQRAMRLAPTRTALAVKRNNDWVKWTYTEYYEAVCSAAKSFIKVCKCLVI